MIGYASNTGTRRNLSALRAHGWRILLTPDNPTPREGLRFGIDNGAWKAFQQKQPFDGDAFGALVERFGCAADFVVMPDIVAGGRDSLAFSVSWFPRLRGLRGLRFVSGVQLGDVLPEDIADRLFVNANIGGDFGEGAFQRTPLDVLHQSPGHVSLLIHVGDRLVEGLAALQALEPLTFDHDSDSLAVHGRVHEPLFLKAVTLQGRVSNSAPDTDGWGSGVFSRDKQINVAFADGKGVPPFKVQEISQEHTVTKSDFSVPVMEGLHGYC